MHKKGYTIKENKFACFWSKKIRLINNLGGKCLECGNSDIRCIDFHHFAKKSKDINYLLWNASLKRTEEESRKCILLCRNCHQEKHFSCGRGAKRKIELFTYLNLSTKCIKCGYEGENLASLDFHHRNEQTKLFSLSDFFNKNEVFYRLAKSVELIEEIKKCDVLCRNCHAKEHFDDLLFSKLKDYIAHKLMHFEERKVFDKEKVKKMHMVDKMSAGAIAREIGSPRSTIIKFLKRENCFLFKGEPGLKTLWKTKWNHKRKKLS